MIVDLLFNRPSGDLVFDIETFPNVFSGFFVDPVSGWSTMFEISDYQDDTSLFIEFMEECRHGGNYWVGYNNLSFDYPVVHSVYHGGSLISVEDIYRKAMSIINGRYEDRFSHVIWDKDQVVPQIDLFKVHHFDNPSKSTGLKVIEFNLQARRVVDLPFPVGKHLTREERDVLLDYNKWDVHNTVDFYRRSEPALRMRRNLSARFLENMLNFSDVKIGERILISELESRGVTCHVYVDGRRQKVQTDRDTIDFNSVILPYIRFEQPAFAAILTEMKGKVISAYTTKGVFQDLVANVHGMEYRFGTGGIHASVDGRIVRSTETHQIVDLDVASYYPNLGIVNELYPAHLGREFCEVYKSIYRTRREFPKGSPENEAYKLALNGGYGNSNNNYSALYDPQYTMSITLNGQLLLAMLIEQLIKVQGLEMIQANTDGVTFLCPRWALDHVFNVGKWWMVLTGLELESVKYTAMFIRDVNSYIAVKEGGKVKRIGAYAYETALENPGTRELPWHKDWSFRVVQMAAEQRLVYGRSISEFIRLHAETTPYDFFGRAKVNRGSRLELDGEDLPNIVRYAVTRTGGKLEKVMPPSGKGGEYKRANGVSDQLFYQVMSEIGPGVWDARIHTKNKSVYSDRRTRLHNGRLVRIIEEWDPLDAEQASDLGTEYIDFDYDFYIKEAEKLCQLIER